eukprot:SAG31_NODE_4265_length_3394_cov_1.455842_2_plen_80_part_00
MHELLLQLLAPIGVCAAGHRCGAALRTQSAATRKRQPLQPLALPLVVSSSNATDGGTVWGLRLTVRRSARGACSNRTPY